MHTVKNMVQLLVVFGSLIVVIGAVLLAPILHTSPAIPRTVTDLSWPNCHVTTSQLGSASGIIGVNDGLDFRGNPCLYAESQLFSNVSLYLNTGYPGVSYGRKFSNNPLRCSLSDTLCLAYNYGYNSAHYAISYASNHDVHTTMWWLDVETSNSWSANILQNRAALSGMMSALHSFTFLPTIGVYSYPGQWNEITGDWNPALPAWVASASASYQVARSVCAQPSFDGGTTWLVQYTTKLDHNYVCQNDYSQLVKP